ncbi:T9SS type A sorting domain-containing protein [bacterium SCSIO 12741]|nr:T9SS type A sorting domain-containing protein [bacterium SCSIO 12741]
MNRKLSLFIMMAAGALTATAQQNGKVDVNTSHPASIDEVVRLDRNGSKPTGSSSGVIHLNTGVRATASNGTKLGTSIYDLQSNASIDNRVKRHSDGTMTAAYTFSTQADPYADRGTGYLYYDGSTWTVQNPTSREEGERIGWPSVGYTKSGREVILSHSTDNDEIHLIHRNGKGSGTWTAVKDPTGAKTDNIGTGYLLWPRMVVGGNNGNTLHMIALTEPSTLQGSTGSLPYQGLDGALVYNRSTDGGNTWDRKHIVLPGMDSTVYANVNADSYSITSRGDVVAVVLAHRFGDLTVAKSMDNGSTWTSYKVIDFPYDAFSLGDRLVDTTITSDNNCDVLIDKNDQLHVFFGSWQWMDDDTSDQSYSVFQLANGLNYWREDFGEDNHQRLVSLIDQDGDPTNFNFVNIGSGFDALTDYGSKSLNSYPSVGMDANGHIYLLFMGIMEDGSTGPSGKGYNDGVKHYRHQFVMKSEDGGCTWGKPMDLTDAGNGFEECAYGCMAKDVDNKVRFIYQEDLTPGTAVGPEGQNGNHSDVTNEIVYVEQATSAIPATADRCITFISGETEICPGDSVELTAACASAYSWSTGETSASIWVKTIGTYTCTMTTPCGSVTETIDVKTPAVGVGPKINLTTSATELCPSGSQAVVKVQHSSIGSSGFYEWNNNGISTQVDSFVTTGPGVVTVKVTNCVGGISSSSITIGSVSSADATVSGRPFLCPGETGVLEVPDNPDGTYTWTLSGSVVGNNRQLNVTQTGTYVATVTACQGSFSAKDSITVAVEPAPSATISASGAVVLCKGEAALSLLAVGQTGATFKWNTGATSSSISINTDSVQVATYNCYSYNACNDSAISNDITVTVKALPNAPVISQNAGVFTANTANAKWYFYDGNSWIYSGVTAQTYDGNAAGLSNNTRVKAIVEDNGCESEDSNEETFKSNIGVSEVFGTNTSVNVYPNPNNGNFEVAFSGIEIDDMTIEVRNSLGQLVYQNVVAVSGNQVEAIQLNGLDNGVYFLNISGDGASFTERVMVH